MAGIQRNTGCSMNGVTARRIRAKSGRRVVIIMGSCPGSSHRRPPLSQSRHPGGANPARESGTSIRHSDCPSLFNAGSSSQLARPRRAPPCAPLPTQRRFGRSATWPPLGRKLKGTEHVRGVTFCDGIIWWVGVTWWGAEGGRRVAAAAAGDGSDGGAAGGSDGNSSGGTYRRTV